ncbi:probable E3 ubiquitin-protein ligase LUL4 [Primulina huaijiensis]|uniref:probable E3 ubiquitin-protein ligase LUL4 n=1 Tax=Primulina huaijiensis TaxID=1492673 RepID=UPI003CC75AAA
MERFDRTVRRKKSLKERLGFNGMSCCGGVIWGLGPTTMSVRDDEEDQDDPINPETTNPNNATSTTQTPPNNSPASPCVSQSTAVTGMNLAEALATERQFRAARDSDHEGSIQSPNSGTPLRMSLMRLLEETECCDEGRKDELEDGGGCDRVCCVCMGRKKGAAFIPCGHTFCIVCSRELWLNRGSCPLCNRSIVEILYIY